MVDADVHTNVGDNLQNALAPSLYGISLMHCMPVSLSVEGSVGLGNCWGIEAQRQYIAEAGFENISKLDPSNQMGAYFIGYKPQ